MKQCGSSQLWLLEHHGWMNIILIQTRGENDVDNNNMNEVYRRERERERERDELG